VLLPDSPSFKAKLAGKRVIVKVSLFSRAFPGTVAASDETGFLFSERRHGDGFARDYRQRNGQQGQRLSAILNPGMARILGA
jgi:hypothetical protein